MVTHNAHAIDQQEQAPGRTFGGIHRECRDPVEQTFAARRFREQQHHAGEEEIDVIAFGDRAQRCLDIGSRPERHQQDCPGDPATPQTASANAPRPYCTITPAVANARAIARMLASVNGSVSVRSSVRLRRPRGTELPWHRRAGDGGEGQPEHTEPSAKRPGNRKTAVI